MATSEHAEAMRDAPSRGGIAGMVFAGEHTLIDPANGITLLGLASALACASLAIAGNLAYAVIALMSAGLCDLFDGFVARRTSRTVEQSLFGGRLDSAVDACAFGFAPVVLMYAAGLDSLPDVLLLFLFAASALWRLAYFDALGLEHRGRKQYFTGLPTTYVALVIPVVFLSGMLGETWLHMSLRLTTAGLSLAMISLVPVRKPTGVFYVVFPLLALALVSVYVVFAHEFMR